MMLISPTILSNWMEEVIDNQEADPLGDTHNQLLKIKFEKILKVGISLFYSHKCPGSVPNCLLKRGLEILVCTAATYPQPEDKLVISDNTWIV